MSTIIFFFIFLDILAGLLELIIRRPINIPLETIGESKYSPLYWLAETFFWSTNGTHSDSPKQ